MNTYVHTPQAGWTPHAHRACVYVCVPVHGHVQQFPAIVAVHTCRLNTAWVNPTFLYSTLLRWNMFVIQVCSKLEQELAAKQEHLDLLHTSGRCLIHTCTRTHM
jgi:hypothetical protein